MYTTERHAFNWEVFRVAGERNWDQNAFSTKNGFTIYKEAVMFKTKCFKYS